MNTKKESEVSLRLIEIMNKFCLTRKQFAVKLKVSESSMNYYLNDNRSPGVEVFIELKKSFPEINLNWFFTGEGSMLSVLNAETNNTKETPSATDLIQIIKNVQEQANTHLKLVEQIQLDSSKKQNTIDNLSLSVVNFSTSFNSLTKTIEINTQELSSLKGLFTQESHTPKITKPEGPGHGVRAKYHAPP